MGRSSTNLREPLYAAKAELDQKQKTVMGLTGVKLLGDQQVKVLQVLDSLNMGGVETWLLELLRYWSNTGSVNMHFLLTGGRPGLLDEEVRGLGGEIHYLRYGRKNVGSFLRGYRRLLAREKFHAIHDHSDLASGLHFLFGLGRLPSVRIVHVHNPLLHLQTNYGVTPTRRALVSLGRKLVKNIATDICGTSAKSLVEYGFSLDQTEPEVAVLHCGIDLSAFNAPRQEDRQSVLREFAFPNDALIALFAGRLDRDLALNHPRNHKNSWLALLIARAAADQNPRFRLLMAGAGEEQKRGLEQHISQWGLSDRFRIIGIRRDLGRLMRAADAFLFPSAQEGLGMVAVEAQAAGTPVLASTAVPHEAVVVPQLFTSLSVDEPPEVWAQTLLHIMSLPRLHSLALRPLLEKSAFSIVNSAQQLERIYCRAARGNFPPTPFQARPPAG